MKVIPTINCKDFDSVKDKLLICAENLGSEDWVQIDVNDGFLSSTESWNNPAELKNFLSQNKLPFNIEIHLMAKATETVLEDWFRAGAKRIILQYEAVFNFADLLKDGMNDGEIGISFGLQTSLDEVLLSAENFYENYGINYFQVLCVRLGYSGEPFANQALEKLRGLKAMGKNIFIEADGGVNLETAKVYKDTGIDAVCSASYIFNASDFSTAYNSLVEL